MFQPATHPTEGDYRVVRSPVQFAEPFRLRHHAPRLGQDTINVMRDAGYSDAEIDSLVAKGAVLAAPPVAE
jgi:crotonobetainyl-CoA:carnitine CoA-transferase CaiB-like acyl-CoA transferase